MTDFSSASLRDRLTAERPDLFVINDKYAPKLSFFDRCCLFGFHKLGITAPVLAEAFGLNRSTVRYIIRPASKHYKPVRKEWAELGEEAFNKRYTASPDAKQWLDKVEAAKKATLAKVNDKTSQALALEASLPDPRAKQSVGLHAVHIPAPEPARHVSVTVLWVDVLNKDAEWGENVEFDEDGNQRTPGWYLTVSDPAFGALSGLASNSRTSTSALKGFLKDVGGEIE